MATRPYRRPNEPQSHPLVQNYPVGVRPLFSLADLFRVANTSDDLDRITFSITGFGRSVRVEPVSQPY